jgi:hypothetical protein
MGATTQKFVNWRKWTTTLDVGIKTAEECDRQVKEILNTLTSADLKSLTGLLGQILGLPETTLVLSTAASPADVRSEVISRLTLVVERLHELRKA